MYETYRARLSSVDGRLSSTRCHRPEWIDPAMGERRKRWKRKVDPVRPVEA
jgi:hypothetical protein